MEKVGAYSNTPTQESGINEPRRSEGHEGRRKKEEGRRKSWEISPRIYAVICSQNARILNIYGHCKQTTSSTSKRNSSQVVSGALISRACVDVDVGWVSAA